MTHPLVLLDVDGVLADFGSGTRDALGGTWALSDVTAWDFSSVPGFDREVAKRAWHEPGFCYGLEPLPYAVEAVRSLVEIADITYCTAPMSGSPSWISERVAWLERYFPHAPIIFANDKSRIRGDILLDDHVKHLRAWRGTCPVCWDAPYNGDWDGARVTSWETFLAFVRAWEADRKAA